MLNLAFVQIYLLEILKIALSAWAVEYANCTSAKGEDPPYSMRPPVGRGWQLVMLKDRILVVEQYFTWKSNGQGTCSTSLWTLLS